MLAPALFAICVNDVIRFCNSTGLGIILVYADDILLVARSVYNLQQLFNVVQTELKWLNLKLNAAKSCWIRIGPRYDKPTVDIMTFDWEVIPIAHYLEVYMKCFCRFQCSFANS